MDKVKGKISEEQLDLMLAKLKVETVTPSENFTANVMQKIKADMDFDSETANIDKIDDLLENMPFIESVNPSKDFTSNVMAKIKADSEKSYTIDNIDKELHKLSKTPIKLPSRDFTSNVISKIKEDAEQDNVISFEKISRKFLIGSAIVAAAAILLALNLFSSYDAGMAEFMVTDYFNTGLY